MTEDVMTTKEVMEYLKISRSTLFRLVRDGRLPAYKLGSQAVRYRRQDVERLIDESRK